MALPSGLRVLVVEDEPLVLLELQDMLGDLGCVVAGAAATLDAAATLARTLDFDIAVLDMNLGGKLIDPVADIIVARGLPAVFVTGYGRAFLGGRQGEIVEKPCQAADLQHAIVKVLRR